LNKLGIACLLLTLAFLGVGLRQDKAEASNGSCNFYSGSGWFCKWQDNPAPTGVRIYFDAASGTNKRPWYWLDMHEDYDYQSPVQKKCLGYKDFGGEIHSLICGGGSIGSNIPSSWRPGWAYIRQFSGGYRNIFGRGWHTS